MNKQLLHHLLEKYKLGECTETESATVEQWLAGINAADGHRPGDTFIKQQLSINRVKIEERISFRSKIKSGNRYAKFAVAASLLFIAGYLFTIYLLKPSPALHLSLQKGIAHYVKGGWAYDKTPKGITGKIKLSDGSVITLNASTVIHYPLKFSGRRRPVYLDDGEALFDVAKNKTSPFTVYTQRHATTALGTSFIIRSYNREHKESISLIHGKIRVSDVSSPLRPGSVKILLPHQRIVFNKLSGQVTNASFNEDEELTAWRFGGLSFQNASADEVINAIENRFDITITNNSKRLNWSYTGTFKAEPLNDVLKTICLTEGISFSVFDQHIILN